MRGWRRRAGSGDAQTCSPRRRQVREPAARRRPGARGVMATAADDRASARPALRRRSSRPQPSSRAPPTLTTALRRLQHAACHRAPPLLTPPAFEPPPFEPRATHPAQRRDAAAVAEQENPHWHGGEPGTGVLLPIADGATTRPAHAKRHGRSGDLDNWRQTRGPWQCKRGVARRAGAEMCVSRGREGERHVLEAARERDIVREPDAQHSKRAVTSTLLLREGQVSRAAERSRTCCLG